MREVKQFEISSYKYEFRNEKILLEIQSTSSEKILIEFSKEQKSPKNTGDYLITISKHLEYFPLIREMLTTEKPVYFNWVKDEQENINWTIGTGLEPIGIYDEDYQQIKLDPSFFYDELIQYMNQKGLETYIEEDRLIISFTYGNQEFLINVLYLNNWIDTGALIVSADDIPKDIDREKLYAKLLMDNLYIKEVNYGLTIDGDIIIHAETAIESFKFENFETEFGSVIYGIQNYVENIEPEFPSLKNVDHTSNWNLNPV